MPSVKVSLPTSVPQSTGSSRRMAVSTLGCKVNLFESNLIAQNLTETDWQTVGVKDKADLYVINTCTVTAEADRQARQEVRRLIRQNPQALVAVTGCYAQMNPQACAAIPGVDLVVGNHAKLDLNRLLSLFEKGELPKIVVGELDQHVSLPQGLLSGFDGHTRAFMQIQQGCNQACTFCIIHRARGPSRSIPMALLRRQAQRLVLNGYRELVICGVDLGSYGDDLDCDDASLVNLIDVLHHSHPGIRLRLSSIDPVHISDGLIDRFRRNCVCPQLHLSMQSADTLILKRMKRRYDAGLLYERVIRLRQAVPELVISADVMTGFPTETQQQFERTLKAIDDLQIAFPHVFPYSQRSGTPAARIPRQVEVRVRKQRAALIRQAGKRVLENLMATNLGRTFTVLTEESIDNQTGLRRSRAENYLPVLVAGSFKANRLVKVVADQSGGNSLIASGTGEQLN